MLFRSNLAPGKLISSGNSVSANSPLMKYVDRNLRKIQVRIPLFNAGAILAGTGSAEMNTGLGGTYSSGDGFTELFTKIHPLKFPIPSEPTVLEIGFQLFFPKMGWEGRDENPKGSGNFRYYDAVYWGDKSDAAGKHQIADYLPISYKFDAESESFSTWPRFAEQRTLKNSILQVDADISNRLGLRLAPLKNNHVDGGLKAGEGYRSPGGRVDDFVDIVVLDMKAPKLIANKGDVLEATTGGRVNDDIVLSVTDNNPYALWDSYESIGDSTKYKRSPALVHFAYEIGYDPKAHLGTGLKTSGTNGKERAYGFHLSYTTLSAGQSQLDANDLPSYRVSMAGLGTPSAQTEPGFTYKPFDIASNGFYFSYPWKADSFPSGGTFVERLKSGGINERADKEDAWARMMNPDVRFYMPDNKYIKQASVRTKDPIVKTNLNSWMISLIPDVNGEVQIGRAHV